MKPRKKVFGQKVRLKLKNPKDNQLTKATRLIAEVRLPFISLHHGISVDQIKVLCETCQNTNLELRGEINETPEYLEMALICLCPKCGMPSPVHLRLFFEEGKVQEAKEWLFGEWVPFEQGRYLPPLSILTTKQASAAAC